MVEETWDKPVPDATDRCDSCRSQAYIIARAYGTLFRWCAHHWRAYEEKLLPNVTELHDYTFLLDEAAERWGQE
jgi:hypothetical protein